jgi:3-hydroxyacyl-[acyl-carrier-protein] dehydratase
MATANSGLNNSQKIFSGLSMRFHLFDKMIKFDPGKSGVAVKNITVAEEFFIKHYDRNPLMPEPLIIEALAQTGGWTVAVSTQFRFVAILVRIDKARFVKPVRPGDQLILKTTILSINENGSLIEGTAEVDGEPVAHVERIMYGNSPVPDQLKDFIKTGYIYRSGGLLDREGNFIT